MKRFLYFGSLVLLAVATSFGVSLMARPKASAAPQEAAKAGTKVTPKAEGKVDPPPPPAGQSMDDAFDLIPLTKESPDRQYFEIRAEAGDNDVKAWVIFRTKNLNHEKRYTFRTYLCDADGKEIGENRVHDDRSITVPANLSVRVGFHASLKVPGPGKYQAAARLYEQDAKRPLALQLEREKTHGKQHKGFDVKSPAVEVK